MTASLRAGKVVTLPSVGLFADGAAVKTVGNETFNVCHQLVDEMITVQTGEGKINEIIILFRIISIFILMFIYLIFLFYLFTHN